MERNTTICAGMETRLADLLLDPETVPAAVKTHVSECDGCRRELEELRATMGLMDAWEAPEPNPYFMTRFQARLREEQQAKPAGWLASWLARMGAIRKHVMALPERQRMAVLMHKYQGLDYRQIGEVLKLSESATKSLLFRAYQTLREKLKDFV